MYENTFKMLYINPQSVNSEVNKIIIDCYSIHKICSTSIRSLKQFSEKSTLIQYICTFNTKTHLKSFITLSVIQKNKVSRKNILHFQDNVLEFSN